MILSWDVDATATTAYGWNYVAVDLTRAAEAAKESFASIRSAFERASPALRRILETLRKLREAFDYGDRTPRALAVPPGAPPVPIDLAAAPAPAPGFVPREELGRPSSRAPARRHERQSVPARSRRRLRTWERAS